MRSKLLVLTSGSSLRCAMVNPTGERKSPWPSIGVPKRCGAPVKRSTLGLPVSKLRAGAGCFLAQSAYRDRRPAQRQIYPATSCHWIDFNTFCATETALGFRHVLIDSVTLLDEWIHQNHFLHDASVSRLDPLPGRGDATDVRVTLQFQFAGSYAAGEPRTMRTIELVAHDLTEYDLDGTYHPEHPAEGANSYDAERGIGFEIDIPGILRIAAERFEVKSVVDVDELVPEWLSNRDFTVVLPNEKLPSPKMWLELLNCSGRKVAWRYYAGDERTPDKVPESEYEGWFVQYIDRLESHTGGLLFDICRRHKHGHVLTVAKNDPECDDLWRQAGDYLSTICCDTISSGNAKLSPDAFRNHLMNATSTQECGTEQTDEPEPE